VPLAPDHRIVADHLLLLRIHADHRHPTRQRGGDLRVDVPELGVAVGVAHTFQHARYALQRETLGP
jgi:hypothetical protein